MTDELEVIAGLEPEQVVERAKALALEVEYWRQILDDAQAISGAVRDAAEVLLNSTATALALLPIIGESGLELAESTVAGNRQALAALKVVSVRLDGMLELADGRTKVLAPVGDALLRAAGVEPGDELEGEAS